MTRYSKSSKLIKELHLSHPHLTLEYLAARANYNSKFNDIINDINSVVDGTIRLDDPRFPGIKRAWRSLLSIRWALDHAEKNNFVYVSPSKLPTILKNEMNASIDCSVGCSVSNKSHYGAPLRKRYDLSLKILPSLKILHPQIPDPLPLELPPPNISSPTSKVPNIQSPKSTVPDIQSPKTKVPDIQSPKITPPELPKNTVTNLKAPPLVPPRVPVAKPTPRQPRKKIISQILPSIPPPVASKAREEGAKIKDRLNTFKGHVLTAPNILKGSKKK